MMNYFAPVLIFASLAMLAIIAYSMFWPINPAQILNEPFPVVPTYVSAGESITMRIEYKKTHNYQTSVVRTIVCDNGLTYRLGEEEGLVPIGEGMIDVIVEIPANIEAGTCQIKSVVTYYINPFRSEFRERSSQDFVIIAR